LVSSLGPEALEVEVSAAAVTVFASATSSSNSASTVQTRSTNRFEKAEISGYWVDIRGVRLEEGRLSNTDRMKVVNEVAVRGGFPVNKLVDREAVVELRRALYAVASSRDC
jgi:hypothetical protein